MILKLILYCCLLYFGVGQDIVTEPPKCLTGTMTDVQSWVDGQGKIIGGNKRGNVIDLSEMNDPISLLQQSMLLFRMLNLNASVEYLSMARCRLTRVPPVFSMEDTRGRPLYDTVRYITLYGNEFHDKSIPGEHYQYIMNATSAKVIEDGLAFASEITPTTWAVGFQKIVFRNLRELDIRSCNIQTLNPEAFSGMPRLEALYLSDNSITQVEANAFHGLSNLVHLDLSKNFYYSQLSGYLMMSWNSIDILASLTKLESLDFSYTKLSSSNLFSGLGSKFQRLSICHTGLPRLRDNIFTKTALKYLDVSGNAGILGNINSLKGLENTLEVLYADTVGLHDVDMLYKFEKLEVLRVSNNEINEINEQIAESWKSAQILDLDYNRITSWFSPTFSRVPNLKLLSLRYNNINLITEEMVEDIDRVSYIGFSGNFFFCNCHSREFFDIAFSNEKKRQENNSSVQFTGSQVGGNHPAADYHTSYSYYNDLIANRKAISSICTNGKCGREDLDRNGDNTTISGNFVIFDYDEESYNCFMIDEGSTLHFSMHKSCDQSRSDNVEDIIRESNAKIIAMISIPVVMIPLLALGYFFRRSFKYFIITMRNSAMLSLINKSDHKDDGTIYNYDVFVSYCNEDRAWVLDNLLPHMESDCNVSVCLHERDFQVGLSILENIVSCMDRSRSIMLIISQRFLLSQWCQFEMHLAQHRLLETRREDLILVLLEDIPKRLRPNTLHYLMLTKTYIVWPKDDSERPVFWRRVRKTLVTQKVKQSDNVSLA